VVNEEPLAMIPSFHYPDKEPVLGNSPRNGWSCCNDVHEVFKCMAETVLVNAFVVERKNGEIVGYNCNVDQKGSYLEVTPNEGVIERVCFNLKKEFDIKIKYEANIIIFDNKKGFFWA
jgi:hypothetical protein